MLRAALAAHPGAPDAHAALGEYQLGRLARPLQLEGFPDFPEEERAAAEAEARRAFDAALALDPAHFDALAGRGMALRRARDAAGARAAYEAAARARPVPPPPPPPPPPRTKWTRRVPHPVLIGHAASLTPY